MATITTDTHSVTASGARNALLAAFRIKRPIMIWGSAGIGKSDVVSQVTQELNGAMIDLRLSQMDPTDLRGVPFFNRDIGKMDWAPPIDLPDEEFASNFPVVVLFLDEINSAPPSVQAAAYQLLLNRRIGKYNLPDNVVMAAAGNKDTDKGVTYRMPMPLANRFLHLDMRADFDTWQAWAIKNNIHSDVVGYISFSKNDLNDFDPRSSSKSFATPRSWSFVSEVLSDTLSDRETKFDLISGAVGEGLARKFQQYQKTTGKLPNPSDVLNGTVKDLNVRDISAMYSLTISMCYELKDARQNKKVKDKEFYPMVNNFITFMMNNFDTELTVLGARTALKVYNLEIETTRLQCFPEFSSKFGKYIVNQ